MAKIQLNGKKININSKLSVFDVLKKYKINEKKVAIELNGKILPRDNLKKKLINNNDIIEVVQFIGGG